MTKKSFPSFVDLSKIKIIEDRENNFRYQITLPFKNLDPINAKRALVILKNPSKARIDHKNKIFQSDVTADRVLNYLYRKNFTEVTILNLFATYETYSENLNKFINEPNSLIGDKNDNIIQNTLNELDSNDLIIVAWGGYPSNSKKEMKELYIKRIKKIESLIYGKNVKFVHKMVENKKFPLHGMTWAYENELYDYFLQKS